MLLPKKLPAAIVTLIEQRLLDEYEAFYYYRSAGNWCRNMGYKYAAEFFLKESDSELIHAAKLEKYLCDWNIMPSFKQLPKPDQEFKGLVDIIEKAYEIEYDLYESYEETATKVLKDDICTLKIIQELLQIQQESVAEYSDMLNEVALINPADKFQIYYLEKRLFKNGL